MRESCDFDRSLRPLEALSRATNDALYALPDAMLGGCAGHASKRSSCLMCVVAAAAGCEFSYKALDLKLVFAVAVAN